MSSARLVPVLIIENIAPWMNATAIAKRDVGVGREARQPRRSLQSARVDREQDRGEEDDRETAGTAGAASCSIERRASTPTCREARLRPRPRRRGRGVPRPRRRRRRPAAGSSPSGARAGALQRAAGLGEEDVVERRRVQPQVGDRAALGVERPDDLGEVAHALGQPHGDAVGRRRGLLAEATRAPRRARSRSLGIDRDRLDARPADRRLELARACPRRRSGRGR